MYRGNRNIRNAFRQNISLLDFLRFLSDDNFSDLKEWIGESQFLMNEGTEKF